MQAYMVVWLKRIVSYITVFIAIGYLVYTTIFISVYDSAVADTYFDNIYTG